MVGDEMRSAFMEYITFLTHTTRMEIVRVPLPRGPPACSRVQTDGTGRGGWALVAVISFCLGVVSPPSGTAWRLRWSTRKRAGCKR